MAKTMTPKSKLDLRFVARAYISPYLSPASI